MATRVYWSHKEGGGGQLPRSVAADELTQAFSFVRAEKDSLVFKVQDSQTRKPVEVKIAKSKKGLWGEHHFQGLHARDGELHILRSVEIKGADVSRPGCPKIELSVYQATVKGNTIDEKELTKKAPEPLGDNLEDRPTQISLEYDPQVRTGLLRGDVVGKHLENGMAGVMLGRLEEHARSLGAETVKLNNWSGLLSDTDSNMWALVRRKGSGYIGDADRLVGGGEYWDLGGSTTLTKRLKGQPEPTSNMLTHMSFPTSPNGKTMHTEKI
ncbi:MAG: hypothetical protein PHG85_01265 [Candidatus Altiarchaeota archaeon]|nr:hypothetical protein [Candidatus Altiarchaeota archaeon]